MLCVVRHGYSWYNHERRFTHASLEVVEVDVGKLTPHETRALFVPDNDKALEGKNTRQELDRFKELVAERERIDSKAQEEEDLRRKKSHEDARDLVTLRASNRAMAEKIINMEADLRSASALVERVAKLESDLEAARATIKALESADSIGG